MKKGYWWPDANITARVERLRAAREAHCAKGLHDDPDKGLHDDPDNSGMCILCGADLDGLVPDFDDEDAHGG